MNNEIIKFVNGDLQIDVTVSPNEETVWLNCNQLAALFDRDVKTIGKHINNALKEELDSSTVVKFATVQKESSRNIKREIDYYNLDMIISVGYRVKSKNGIIFRKWATFILKDYMIKGYAVSNTGFLESIPLWAVTLLGSIFITILSFVMILTVYGRFFKMYMYTAISPIPLAAAAGESTQNTAFTFIKSYASVCLEGAIIVLACIIFSAFASSPPVVDSTASSVSMIWSYIGELIFNMLVLVGTIKMSDRIVKEMMGL